MPDGGASARTLSWHRPDWQFCQLLQPWPLGNLATHLLAQQLPELHCQSLAQGEPLSSSVQ